MFEALCGVGPLSAGLILGLFLAGLAGSPMHCGPMCGGFVLGQVADRVARLPVARLSECRRLQAGALLPYHLGRLTTYAGLGALAASGGAVLARLPWLGFVPAALLLLAAALFVTQALRRLLPAATRHLPMLDAAPPAWGRFVARGARRVGSGYPLGVALGFLPCGFLYGALAAAASTGDPWLGAAGMLAFGCGTVPALVAVGVAGQVARRRWQRGVTVAAPAVMLLNAALLAWIALTPALAAMR